MRRTSTTRRRIWTSGHVAQHLERLGSRCVGSGPPGVPVRRIWTALLTKYESEGAQQKEKKDIFVRPTSATDSDRLARARRFASPARTQVMHERNEADFPAKNLAPETPTHFFNLRL